MTKETNDTEKLDDTKEIENEWWKDLNPFCIECVKDCKQSNQVVMVYCPHKIKKKDDNGDLKNDK